MKLLRILPVCALLSLSLWAQAPSPTLTNTCAAGAMPEQGGTRGTSALSCTNSQTITTSGRTVYIFNRLHGVTVSLEKLVSGSPDGLTTVIAGCMKGGTCETTNTETSTSSGILSPSTSKVYDYYTVTATWTGRTNVSVTINTSITTARIGIPGLHFDGKGNASLDGSFAAARRTSVRRRSILCSGLRVIQSLSGAGLSAGQDWPSQAINGRWFKNRGTKYNTAVSAAILPMCRRATPRSSAHISRQLRGIPVITSS